MHSVFSLEISIHYQDGRVAGSWGLTKENISPPVHVSLRISMNY
jgi:hypothetical protein